jgi:iron complex transport system substrate-binding protein
MHIDRHGVWGERILATALTVAMCVCATMAVATAPLQAQERGSAQRIVSLDVCTDQILVELVGRERIAAVTHLAADPAVSAIPAKAKGIAITHGAAEDVLRYDPDLILAGPFGVSATVSLLRRLKRNVVVVPQPPNIEAVRAAVRAVAAAVGEGPKGEAMIAAFDHRLAGLDPPASAAPPTAIIYQVGGSVSGPGSLAEAALVAAGFRNKADEYRLTRNGQVPLELLVAAPPDLLVLSSAVDEYRTALADNLRHPVLRRLRQHHASLELPWQLWLCGTPHIAEAIEKLADARSKLEARAR